LGAAANWTSPVNTPANTVLNGKAAANRSTITTNTAAIIPVLNPGQYCMIKWTDTDEPGNDGYQALDDVSVTVLPWACSINAQISGVTRQRNGAGLADDTFTFNVTVSELHAHGSWTCDIAATNGTKAGAYGASVAYGPFPVSQSPITLHYRDV